MFFCFQHEESELEKPGGEEMALTAPVSDCPAVNHLMVKHMSGGI